MDEKRFEIRTTDCQLAVREANEDAQGENRTIAGRAIVFNSESEVLDDFGQRFREIILPQAVTQEFLDSQDIKMNMLHDRQLTLARRNKGKGSLRLGVDADGVWFEFEAPRCDIGDRALEMVRRGDYSGCSFEFYSKDYDIEERGKNDVVIRHREFRALTALTIGMDPAYKQTTVNARELYEQHHQETEEEKLAREQSEAEAKHQAEEDASRKAAEEEAMKRDYEYRKRQLEIDN